jgi:hypothetical protein
VPARHVIEVYNRSKYPIIKTLNVKCVTLIVHAWSNFIIYRNLGPLFFKYSILKLTTTTTTTKSIVEKNKITSVGFNFPLCYFCLWVTKVWPVNR